MEERIPVLPSLDFLMLFGTQTIIKIYILFLIILYFNYSLSHPPLRPTDSNFTREGFQRNRLDADFDIYQNSGKSVESPAQNGTFFSLNDFLFIFLKNFAKKFAYIKKKQYFCTDFLFYGYIFSLHINRFRLYFRFCCRSFIEVISQMCTLT